MIDIVDYPDLSLNKELRSWIDFLPHDTDEFTNLAVEKHTGYNTYPKPFIKLKDWVVEKLELDPDKIEYQLWGAVYNYGDFAYEHRHGKNEYSFVYYVSTPPGSSPLNFDGYIIQPHEGMCVIFQDELHSVPENECDGRVVVAGNLRYSDTDL
tara:strand:+ start:71 stop:529 length:459 start_codon:yes stop_codon:yes gene_type:complete